MEALIPSWAVVTLICVATLAFVSKTFFQKSQNSLYLPPGPKPWPIIGNLNLIGPLPHQSLHKLSQIYGPIMQLKFGSFPVVIASSAEMAKQFLKTHDHVFASRPQMAAGKYTTYNYSNITWAPYGPYWRQGRKIYLSELFSSKRLESYEYIRVEERLAFLKRLYLLSGKPILLKDQLSRVTLSIISRIVLGKKYFSESSKSEKSIVTLEEFQEMLDELFLLNGVLNIGDWIPWLKFLDLQGYEKRMKALKKKFDRFHDYVFDEHKARNLERGENSNIKDLKTKDMVDLLLQLADDPDLEVKLTYNSVKGFTQSSLANMLHGFKWKLPDDMKEEDLSMDEVYGLATIRKFPLVAVTEPRLPDHLYQMVRQMKALEKKFDQFFDFVYEEHKPNTEGEKEIVEQKDRGDYYAIMEEAMIKHPLATTLALHEAIEDCKAQHIGHQVTSKATFNSMEISRWDVLAPSCFAALAFLFAPITHLPSGGSNKFPPGPKPWPIIGNLNLIGSVVVFINGGGFALGYNLAVKMLMCSSKRLDSYEYIRMEEMKALMSSLYASLGKPIVLEKKLSCFTFSLMSRIVLGKRYFNDSRYNKSTLHVEEFKKMAQEFMKLHGAFNIGDWIPWLEFFDLQGYVRRMKTLVKNFDQFFDFVYDEHKVNREREKDFFEPRNMAGLLLELMDDPNLDVKLTYDSVKALTQASNTTTFYLN
ncbi:hypothetical protein FEM48_Zijuj08G0021800 [Ziziphus jujuba var. spinosa]|uniref:Flavonoid 3'-monooxygenase-like n=1 Tax=Ziziphus jujuba var. spinosa TaxID=714518 RepID=A0A978UWD8_ZIZJJ|nr:hypothetical protein FEM48_Zijuj08G0021800 [Ziziphus jujuba var. spinosa]